MKANVEYLKTLWALQPVRKVIKVGAVLLVVAVGVGLLLVWTAMKRRKDGFRRERDMEDKNEDRSEEKEHPLKDGKPGFEESEIHNQEGAVPPEKDSSFINLRALIIAAAGLVGMIVFVHLLAGVLFGYFSILNPFGQAAPPSEPGNMPPTMLPPAPTLQVNYQQDLQRVQATQEAHLEGYGWVDQKAGTVHIPIERAMELVAQRGLPVTTATPEVYNGDGPDDSGFGFSTPSP